jgi:hypothetical protein
LVANAIEAFLSGAINATTPHIGMYHDKL